MKFQKIKVSNRNAGDWGQGDAEGTIILEENR